MSENLPLIREKDRTVSCLKLEEKVIISGMCFCPILPVRIMTFFKVKSSEDLS